VLPSARAEVKTSAISDIKVFVFTAGPDEGELVNPQTVSRHKQAIESVEDLKKLLAKNVRVIEERDEADVTLEVLARGDVKPGTTTPSRDESKDGSDSVHISLMAGDYRAELAGYSPHAQIIGARRAPAKDVTRKIEAWIDSNHDKLIANRAKSDAAGSIKK
jgi:hypothetical protein